MRSSSLVQRSGYLDSHATLIRAALLSAHAIHGRHGGFRAVDVRFYFRLFSNWLEQDILRPSQDVELTQIRRALQVLQREGHASPIERAPSRQRARGQQFRLSESGLMEMAEKLVEEVGVSFEEVLFVLLFGASYRDALKARVLGASVQISGETRRKLGNVLSPKRVVQRALGNAERLVRDLRERIAADQMLENQIARHRGQRMPSSELIRILAGVGGYQLERVRSFQELLQVLPEDLREAELTHGIEYRRLLLFRPLLSRAEEELNQLQKLAKAF